MVALIGFTARDPRPRRRPGSRRCRWPRSPQYWLGPVLTTVFLAIVVFSMFALIVVAAASNSRLLFAMARDGLLPGSALLRRVNARTGTPVPALVALAGRVPGAARVRHARGRRVRRARRRHRARAVPGLPAHPRRLPGPAQAAARARRGRVPAGRVGDAGGRARDAVADRRRRVADRAGGVPRRRLRRARRRSRWPGSGTSRCCAAGCATGRRGSAPRTRRRCRS